MMGQNSNKLKKQREELPKAISDSLKIMGSEAVTFFKMSFTNQGFTDETFEKWDDRVKEEEKERLILVKTGDLRNSIRVTNTTLDSVTIGTDVPYARYHNEGIENGKVGESSRNKTIIVKIKGNAGFKNGKVTKGRSSKMKIKGDEYKVSSHERNLPKREFMGNSKELFEIIKEKINSRIRKIFKVE